METGSDANQAYGSLAEGVHIAGYSLERAWRKLEWLLEENRWRAVGSRFDDVNAFLDSIKLDSFRIVADQRKRIAQRIKELQPEASNRQVAKLLGVNPSTVDRDTAANAVPSAKMSNDDSVNESTAAAFAASPLPTSVSGADAAALVDRKERAEQRREETRAVASQPVIVPEGKNSTVVIDPPWAMEKIERDVRPNQVAFDYPTMSFDELVAFGETVGQLADDDCHLFMWTTQKFLPDALALAERWGFRYVLTMVWHKPGGYQPIGLPQYNCEFVVYARRGAPKFTDTKAFNCCFEAPRREHSRKPDEFYDLIRRVTDEPRIDVFSREPRPGFAQFGNETSKFAEAV